MALAERLRTTPTAIAGTPCSIGTALATLEGDELAALKEMLASHDWSANMVYDALTGEGITVGRQSISRHRGHKCRCYQ